MTQTQVLQILKTGQNVFLTGEPGSGKTHTINQYVKYLRVHGVRPAITASTGIAATHLGGMTLHSWSGIGINKFLSREQLQAIAAKSKLADRIGKASVLIIDEVSMLPAATLDCAEAVCRQIRKNDKPWGGVQVIFVGDFFQLPPVARFDEPAPRFAYESSAWRQTQPVVCYLSEQFRQADKTFLAVLGAIRSGAISEEMIEILNARKLETNHKTQPTRLYSHNADVDRINDQHLASLPGESQSYQMQEFGSTKLLEPLKRGCLSPELLKLKIGAKVMFTKNNFEQGFVNGTLGEVIKFLDDDTPVVRTIRNQTIEVTTAEWMVKDDDRTLARIVQLPLRLAWAMTVHKSQGMTLDSTIMDLSNTFEYGQGYVALSRVRSLDGLFLLGMNARALQVHPEVLAIDATFREQSDVVEDKFSQLTTEELQPQHQEFLVWAGGQIQEVKSDVEEMIMAKPSRRSKISTYEETLALWQQGMDLAQMAEARGVTFGTILSHLEELSVTGKISVAELSRIIPEYLKLILPKIQIAISQAEGKLSPVFAQFHGEYSYDDLRLARILNNFQK